MEQNQIGEIEHIRLYMGLDPKKMAQLLGVHVSTYRKWENGERTINVGTLMAAKTYMWLYDNYPEVFDAYLVHRRMPWRYIN